MSVLMFAFGVCIIFIVLMCLAKIASSTQFAGVSVIVSISVPPASGLRVIALFWQKAKAMPKGVIYGR